MSHKMIRRCLANRSRVAAALGWTIVIYLIAPSAADLAGLLPAWSSREARIHKALAGKTVFDFSERPLAEAVDDIARRHGIEVLLDRKVLAEEGIACDSPITCQVKGVSLRSALRLAFDDLDLTYVVRDGYLLLTTKAEAEGLLSVDVYPVGDLVGADKGLCPPVEPGTRNETVRGDLQELIDTITSTVDNTTWDDVGGPGTAKDDEASKTLAIGQTSEVHDQIATLFDALRLVRDRQIEAAQALVSDEPDKTAEAEMRLTAYWIMSERTAANQPPPGKSSAQNAGWGSGMAGDGAAGATATPVHAREAARAAAEQSERDRTAAKTAKMASVITELIEPQSWQPRGQGLVRATEDSIVVRQTDEVQRKVATLLTQMAPGRVMYWQPRNGPPRLSVDGPQRDWPARAEPHTERDAAIERALNTLVDLDVSAMPLTAVLKNLAAQCDLPMQIDMRRVGDQPVTRRLRGTTLREVLKFVLNEFGLAYDARDEVLLITTAREAENRLTTKVYPVFDLACRPRAAAAAGRWQPTLPGPSGMWGGATQRRKRDRTGLDYQSLIDGLTTCIAPATWDDVGGPGAVTEFAPAGALVVSQTAVVHEEIARYLKKLREAVAKRRGVM